MQRRYSAHDVAKSLNKTKRVVQMVGQKSEELGIDLDFDSAAWSGVFDDCELSLAMEPGDFRCLFAGEAIVEKVVGRDRIKGDWIRLSVTIDGCTVCTSFRLKGEAQAESRREFQEMVSAALAGGAPC